MERDDLIDLLLGLQHDLGKYILMPVSFLPEDASPSAVSEALRRALFETRRGPEGTRSAREIWTAFVRIAGTELDSYPSFAEVRAAVERALTWEGPVGAGRAVERTAAQADLSAVSPAIRNLIQEVNRDR